MEATELDNVVLALLFASDEPLSARKLSAIVDDVDTNEIRASIERIGDRIRVTSPCIKLESVAGGWQLSTNPEYADYIARLYSGRRKQRLSKAALETVAIIAYKQPVTRADIENIRGVSCGGVITTLMERTLIRIVGKARVLGAPFLYGTTQEFLEYLGINSVKDLPSMEDLEALLEREESSQAADEGAAVPETDEAAVVLESDEASVVPETDEAAAVLETDEASVAPETDEAAAVLETDEAFVTPELDGTGVVDDMTAASEATEIEDGHGGSAKVDKAVAAGAPFTSSEGLETEQERDVEKRGEEETHEWETDGPQDEPPAEDPPDKLQTDR